MTDSADSWSPPSVETLLTTTLPFADADDLLHRIVGAWCAAFALQGCAMIWRNPFTVTGELAGAFADEEFNRQRLGVSVDVNESRDMALASHERLTTLAWHALQVGDETIGFVGTESTREIESFGDWMTTTARLLATMLTWESSLQQAKLAALGEFAAGAGHEINNPLAAIRGRAEQLLATESDPQRRQMLETIGAQAFRIRDMIGDTMLFARPPEMQREEVNLTELVAGVVANLTDDFNDRGVSLWGRRERVVLSYCDRVQLAIVISELIRNALHAVSDRGRITIDCVSMPEDQLPCLLRIADNGRGFSAEEREHCFDPFYSGRQAGRGLGFGLSKCWRIITEHGGTISLQESDGTEFCIRLPGVSV